MDSLILGLRLSRAASRPLALATLVLFVLGLVLSACASSSPAAPASAPAAAPASAGSNAPASAAGAKPAASQAGQPSSGSNNSTSEYIPTDRMVIRNAKLSMQVENVEAALARVRSIADIYGGYVSGSHTYYEKSDSKDAPQRMVADVTIAVRADTYDRAVEDLRQLATKVENEDGASQDVTEEYTDLDSQLRNLRATQDALLKLMDKTTQLSDILTLQQQLTTVRGQIEQIEGRQRYLQHATTMSTISISLHLPPAAVTLPPPEPKTVWSPLATFEKGWQASLVALEAVADAVILFVAFFWWLAPIAVIGYIFYRRERARPRPAPPT